MSDYIYLTAILEDQNVVAKLDRIEPLLKNSVENSLHKVLQSTCNFVYENVGSFIEDDIEETYSNIKNYAHQRIADYDNFVSEVLAVDISKEEQAKMLQSYDKVLFSCGNANTSFATETDTMKIKMGIVGDLPASDSNESTLVKTNKTSFDAGF